MAVHFQIERWVVLTTLTFFLANLITTGFICIHLQAFLGSFLALLTDEIILGRHRVASFEVPALLTILKYRLGLMVRGSQTIRTGTFP